MYFTLAISAATRQTCAALVSAAAGTDPRVMPIPGPPEVGWRAPDGRTALLCWPGGPEQARARTPGTIWISPATDGLHARTGVTRVDPVYLAEVPGAVVVSDRASWAAAVAGRLDEPDPVMVAAFLSLGYPVGAATPFRGVRALGPRGKLTVTGGRPVVTARWPAEGAGAGSYGRVADALVEAVRPLAELGVPVELSLTGGKDSRLIAAALTAAKVPFRARTHGFASHPDVIVAAMIAEPARRRARGHRAAADGRAGPEQAPGAGPDEADVLARLRSAVLVSDGMLSAFENVGPARSAGDRRSRCRPEVTAVSCCAAATRPPPGADAQARRGPGARRGGPSCSAAWSPAAWACCARPRPVAYLASLAPFAAALPRGPLRTLDDFYLVNRAGRWSAAARQGYLIRAPLVQPFFSDPWSRRRRAVPLPDRITDRLHRGVLAALCPELLDLPLAGSGWKSGPRTPPVRAAGHGPGPAARQTGGGATGARWPGCCATTRWTSAPRAGCSTWSGGRRPSGRCARRRRTRTRSGRWPPWPRCCPATGSEAPAQAVGRPR